MKRYETYKDSGIQGVGEIPSHWDSNKLKFFADISTGTTPSTANEEYWNEATENWYTPADFNEGDIHLNGSSRKVSAMAFEKSACKVFKKNVVLVVGIGATLGKIGFSRVECSANQQINAIEFYDNVYPLFGAYYLSSLKEVMKSLASAATLAIMNQSVTGSIPFVCPTLAEQKNISAYLDHKVGQIDVAIAEKEQMLEDLKNYRSAIISEAVTKGLDKNVEMKDSGIEWCGYIPIHWQVLKIGYIFQNLDYLRQPISSENRERNNPQYEYYGASGVIDKIDSYNVNDKVLLIGEDGANLVSRTLPLIYKAEGKFWVNNHAHILKPISSDYDYMAFLLETVDYTNYITGSAQPKLSQEKLSSVKLPVPPIEEQKQIAKKLICIVPLIDRSLIEIEKIIKDLKSYKSALITEAVTGKIDLREWKPKEENV